MKSVIVITAILTIIQGCLWLGLLYGALWILQDFGILRAAGVQ